MKIKKILGTIVLAGYLASELLSYLGYVDRGRAEAASIASGTTTPLVAVLIDNDTYNAIGTSSNFGWYTNSYLHEKYPDSQAIILPLDTKEYTAPEIVKLLENIYFDGFENEGSRLVGVLIMGNIPFPVVKYGDYVFPSVYPYVDFIEQKYIWNEDEGYFVINNNEGQAELRHGVISLENAGKYDEFFEKLKNYQKDPEKFIDKKIWYDDFIALNKNFLEEVYYLYQNKLIFAEDLMYHRYTNFFVNLLQTDQQDSNLELIGDLAEGFKKYNIENADISAAQELLSNNTGNFTPTLLLQNKISSFIKDYYEVLSTPLLRTIDDNIKASDRWTVNDSHYQKIQLKDQLLLGNDETNGILKSINDKLENYVDQKIATEKYEMKTTVPTLYYEGKDKKKRILWKKRYIPDYYNTYQFFYFGRDAQTITNAQDFSIYRGTYRNLDKFVKYSSIINDANNPAKSSKDKTDLTKKGVGASYDLFSTQVEANRGYNVLNMQSEYETYNKEKIHAERERVCTSYLFGIHWNILCKRKERENKGSCEIGGDETGCENFIQFGNRVYGGGTPLNLDMDKYTNQEYSFAGEYHYENALKPLFDIAGSVKTTSAINDATNFTSYKTYISPTLISDKYGHVLGTDQHLEAPYHIGLSTARYFNVGLGDKVFTKISDNEFMLKKNKSGRTDNELIYKYKIIPSIVKHDAAQSTLINGYDGYRYTGDKETYVYYTTLLDALEIEQTTGDTYELTGKLSKLEEVLTGLDKKIKDSIAIDYTKNPEYDIGLTGVVSTGIQNVLEFSNASINSGNIYTLGQSKKWDNFNAIFGTNYGDKVIGLIIGYRNRQIELSKKVDIRSVWYDEIMNKIDKVSTYLTEQSKVGSGIFDTFNRYYDNLDSSLTGVNQRIDVLSGRIAAGETKLQELIDELGAGYDESLTIDDLNNQIENLSGEIDSLNNDITILSGQLASINNEISNLNSEISELEGNISQSQAQIETISGNIVKCDEEWIPEKDAIIYSIATNTGTYYTTANTGDRIIAEANKIIENANTNINTYNGIIATNSGIIANANTAIAGYNSQLPSLTGSARTECLNNIQNENTKINNANATINENRNKIRAEESKIATATAAKELVEACRKYPQDKIDEENKLNGYITSKGAKESQLTSKQDEQSRITTTINNKRNEITAKNNQISANGIMIIIIKLKEDITTTSGAINEREKVRDNIQTLSGIVTKLNMYDPCIANHNVLGDIIGASSGDVQYGTENDAACVCDPSDPDECSTEGTSGEETTGLLSELLDSLKGAKQALKDNFNSDPENPEEHIDGMNMLTQDRPIDSPRYVTFQGIGGNVVKFIYPNIFKVEVYKSSGDNILLKQTSSNPSKDEIYQALKEYFQNKVSEYNTLLNNERNSKIAMNDHYNLLMRVDPLATPNMTSRPYNAFTYREMVDAIGGEEMLYTLSELLYYQSVSNKIREYIDDIGEDINETKTTFDVNKKISYVMKEYLTQENDKFYKGELNGSDKNSYAGLIIPGYSTGGYEVGYINSNGNDSVTPGFDEIDATLNGGTTRGASGATKSSTTSYTLNPADEEGSMEIKKDCKYDPNEPLSLYDGSWFEGLACWLKAVAKKPLTLEVYFQTSPTLSSITEPIEESLDDFKQNFSTTIESFQNTAVSDGTNEKTQKIINNTQISWNDKKVSVLSKTGTLNFLSLEDVGNVLVKIETTGDNCLIINGTSSCNGTVTTTKNPYRSGFSLNYTLAKDTIGTVMASVSLCSSADNCGVRNMSLSVVPGPITQFEITPQGGNKILAGAYTLLNIKAMDSKKNEINRSLENYILKTNRGNFIVGGTAQPQIEINDFVNTTIIYRAAPGTNGSVEFSIADTNGTIISKGTANILDGDIKLKYQGSEIASLKYTISDEPYYLTGGELNTKKVIPIKISLTNGGVPVPITVNASLGTEKQLVKIMVAQESKNNDGSTKTTLREANSINITNGELTVYLVPGYVAGEDTFKVTVPGLDTKTIKLTLEPGELKSIGITLEEDVVDPEEKIKAEIALTDAWGNKINKDSDVSISVTTENMIETDGLKVRKAANFPTRFPRIYSGYQEISLKTTNNDTGLHKITVKTKDEKITASKTFTVRNFFLEGAVQSGLNILYLNLFGSDWGNERGYESKNSKFAEQIIQSSKKTLAITTQLIDPSKIKEASIIFGEDGNLQNNGGLTLKATLENAKLKLLIEKVGTLTINDALKNIKAIKNDVNNEWLLELLESEDKSILLYNMDDSYIYTNGEFHTQDGTSFASIKGGVNFERTSNYLNGYPIWNVTSNGKILASAIINHLDYSKVEGDIDNIDYEIGDLYDKGSTSSKIKALYSKLNTLDNAYEGYDSIQNSDDMEKYIGFRGNFKNITLFAEGESVGEATIPYGSEFLINIGDPLLKNRDEVASVRGLGQEMYALPGKTIFKVIDIDYNNDGLRDLIIIYKDGSIILKKQYANKKFQDMGTLMVSAEQIDEVYVGDVDGNKYEDIIIKNGNNQLRVYTNDDGVFDVDGNIVCLNTNIAGGEISKTPEDLSGAIQMYIDDMDNDGRTDIVILDKKGYLKIFYGNGSKTRHSYLSKDVYSCDSGRYDRQEGQTKLVKKFGLKLTSDGVADSSILRRNGLKYPSDENLQQQILSGNLDPNESQSTLELQGIYTDPAFLASMEDGNISTGDIDKIVNIANQVDTTKQAQKATEASTLYIKNPFIGKYEFNDGLKAEEQAFITMYNVEKYNGLTNTKKINKPTKKYVDLNGGDLEEGDIIEVTVSITTPSGGYSPSAFFDKITGPWIIDRDADTGAPSDLTFIKGKGEIIAGTDGYDYGIVNINGAGWGGGGNGLQFKYNLTYHMDTPIYEIRVEREDPLINIASVSYIEKDDTSIVRWNGLKYDSKHQDILIENPFGNQLAINDGVNFSDQAYININDIGTYIDRLGSKEVYGINKSYKDINGGSLENGDKVEVTVSIPLPKSHAHYNAYFEKLEGPWSESGLPSNFQFTKGSGSIKKGINGYSFYVTDFNEASNGEEYIIEFKYTLTYKDSNGTPISDNLPYIVIQPIDGCIKKEEILENAKSSKNRDYKSKIVDLQEEAKKYADELQSNNEQATSDINEQITNAQNLGTESTLLNSVKENFGVGDLLEKTWNNLINKNGLDFGDIDLDITEVLGADLTKIEGQVQYLANKMCNGFPSFGVKGKKTCEGLPVPFNQAFLAPGSYHIMGCIQLEPLTRTLGKGLPIFFWPGNLGPIPFVGFLPIPYMPTGAGDDFLWVKGVGPYSSLIRIYAAPTLTAQLGLAICVGPYNAGINMPSPIADIAGNCVVTAMALPCGSSGDGSGDDDSGNGSGDDTYEAWVSEYGKTNTCNPSSSESPFTMVANNGTLNANGGSYPRSINEGEYLGGLINVEYDSISSYGENGLLSDGGDSGISINGVKIQGAKDIKNKLLGGLVQGIQKMLVDWFDRQVQYWINNLFRFEIEFTFPDISYLADEINKISFDNISDIDTASLRAAENERKSENNSSENALKTQKQEQVENAQKKNPKAKGLTGLVESINKVNISKDNIRNLNLANGANPFKDLQELFNQTELVNISTQSITINVPWIFSEDIEAYKNYLLTRYEQNKTTLAGWEAAIEIAIASCNKEKQNDEKDEKTALHCQALKNAQATIMRLSSKFDKTAPQIFENIQTLEAYKRFPLEIYEWLHITDKYLGDIAALVSNFFGYINYWMDVNATRFTQYVDAIITIVAIVKTYQIMIDLFVDWGAKCGKCTQDTYDQYTCKLSFLCSMFEIPTIPIPSVKIPSLYIDLSHLNLGMNIVLPRFTFNPISIELPKLPNLPEPPQIGINFDIDFDIPDIPQLPQPPELPELPSFIPQVKMELPILPPAPEIPEIPNEISSFISIAKTISNIFCIIKSGIGLVAESAVKARIEQMTQRSYEVPWVDNLDLSLYFKQTPLQGVDIQVDSFVNLQFNFDAFYAFLKGIVDEVNNATYNVTQIAQNGVQYINQTSADWTNKLNDTTNQNIQFDINVSKTNTAEKMKNELSSLRDAITNELDKKKLDEVIAYTSTDSTVKKNEEGLSKMEKEISSIISSEKSSLNDLAELAKQDYNSFLNALEKNGKEEPLQLTFSTNLLNTNERAEKAINKVNPRDMFIETENKKVDGYYSALKNHTANELNMTEETYNNSIKYLASLKGTIDEYYSIKRTEYAGSTYLKDIEGNTVSKPLLTAAGGTNTETTVSASTDYSQYIKGIFIMSGDDVINAVNSEYNYEKFQSYYEKDLDKDGKTELIMRDSNHVFIKYFDNVKGSTGKTSVVVKPSLEDGKSSQYLTTRNGNLKVYDEISEIKNFKLNGQSYESIAFSRDNADGNISGYIMRLVERVDGFWEKNSKNNIKFILFLPNELEGETNNLKIRLPGETSPVNISSLIGSKIYSIKYYNSADDSLRVSLGEVPRRREYVQIASLKLDNTVYLKNSPWSNQLVGGRQVVGDGNAPTASVELLRSKKNDEVADIGFDLEGYVGTYYTLQITREDPTKVRVTKLEEYDSKNNTGKLLNEKDFDNFAGIIRLENLFFTGNQTKQYNISAVDSQGNETQETINLNIIIPGITIENVERQEGYKEGIKNPVSIVSELETDIDEGTVSFERNRNNITAPITSTTNGNQELTYEVTTNQTTVTGQYYDFGDEVGLYSKDNKLIATVDGENGNIEIKQEYASQTNIRVDFSQGYPIIKLMQGGIANFEILLQPESLVKVENAVGTTLTKLQGNNYGMFNGGDVLMKNKTPMLYIATNGTLYTTESLQGDYSFNAEDNTVTYKIYEPFSTTELVSVTFKVKPLE